MKRFFYVAILVLTVSAAQAQEKFVKMDGGIGAALTFGNASMYGISAAIEPKFFFSPKISVGLRTEGDVLFGGNIESDGSNVSVNTSSRAAILAKGEYYFGDNSTRFFTGLGAGWYTQANIGTDIQGQSVSSSTSAVNSFGFAPQVGVTFNNFRISGIYHVVLGDDVVNIGTGDGVKLSRNYAVIELGFKIFQVDVK